MPRKGTRRKWDGGRVWIDEDGTERWVIERMVSGRRKAIALDVASEREALAELALWNRNPDSYKTGSQVRREAADRAEQEALFLDDALIDRFAAYQAKRGREPRYIDTILRAYLGWWKGVLAGKSLKCLTASELRRAIASTTTAERARGVSIKSLFSWLRDIGMVERSEDPTLEIRLPPIKPEKSVREKGYTLAHIEALYGAIESQDVRDAVCLLAKTGMHLTELARIARKEGKVTRVAQGEIAATIRFVHKSGDVHVQALDAQAFAAVVRLTKRGSLPSTTWLHKCLREAEEAADLPRTALSEMRHSFVTNGIAFGVEVRATTGGIPLATMSTIVGHHDPRTTRRFYDGTTIPPLIALPLNLIHPDDPPWTAEVEGVPVEKGNLRALAGGRAKVTA